VQFLFLIPSKPAVYSLVVMILSNSPTSKTDKTIKEAA